jgi:hypothetical protein
MKPPSPPPSQQEEHIAHFKHEMLTSAGETHQRALRPQPAALGQGGCPR